MCFAILQSGLNLSDYGLCQFAAWLECLRRFRSVASLPIESRPCFPRMASQRSVLFPLQRRPLQQREGRASCWSPRTWHTDGNFGLRAEDTAPRSFTPRDSGRPIRVRTRREVRLAGLSPLPVALQLRRGADPSLNNQTCSLRAKPACCDFARLALRISQHRSASSKRKPRYGLSIFFWGFRTAQNYAPGQAYWNEDGIISSHDSPFCRFAVVLGPRANLRHEPRRSSRGITRLRELVQEGLF